MSVRVGVRLAEERRRLDEELAAEERQRQRDAEELEKQHRQEHNMELQSVTALMIMA